MSDKLSSSKTSAVQSDFDSPAFDELTTLSFDEVRSKVLSQSQIEDFKLREDVTMDACSRFLQSQLPLVHSVLEISDLGSETLLDFVTRNNLNIQDVKVALLQSHIVAHLMIDKATQVSPKSNLERSELAESVNLAHSILDKTGNLVVEVAPLFEDFVVRPGGRLPLRDEAGEILNMESNYLNPNDVVRFDFAYKPAALCVNHLDGSKVIYVKVKSVNGAEVSQATWISLRGVESKFDVNEYATLIRDLFPVPAGTPLVPNSVLMVMENFESDKYDYLDLDLNTISGQNVFYNKLLSSEGREEFVSEVIDVIGGANQTYFRSAILLLINLPLSNKADFIQQIYLELIDEEEKDLMMYLFQVAIGGGIKLEMNTSEVSDFLQDVESLDRFLSYVVMFADVEVGSYYKSLSEVFRTVDSSPIIDFATGQFKEEYLNLSVKERQYKYTRFELEKDKICQELDLDDFVLFEDYKRLLELSEVQIDVLASPSKGSDFEVDESQRKLEERRQRAVLAGREKANQVWIDALRVNDDLASIRTSFILAASRSRTERSLQVVRSLCGQSEQALSHGTLTLLEVGNRIKVLKKILASVHDYPHLPESDLNSVEELMSRLALLEEMYVELEKQGRLLLKANIVHSEVSKEVMLHEVKTLLVACRLAFDKLELVHSKLKGLDASVELNTEQEQDIEDYNNLYHRCFSIVRLIDSRYDLSSSLLVDSNLKGQLEDYKIKLKSFLLDKFGTVTNRSQFLFEDESLKFLELSPVNFALSQFRSGELSSTLEGGGAKHVDVAEEIKTKRRLGRKYVIRATFYDIPMLEVDGRLQVNKVESLKIIEGTPLTWRMLERIGEANRFGNANEYHACYLPAALTIAKVLKERGIVGEEFLSLWRLGMAISMKESGVGTNTFDFTYGAAGLTQFQRSTRDEFFFSLPIEERKQYPELYKASLEAEQYISEKGYYYFNHEKKEWRITGKYTKPEVFKFSELLTDYIMHSPTLASRFMLSYCRDRLVPRVEAEKVDRSHKDFSRWVWLSYNVGAGYLKRFIAFYKKFPNPRKNADTTQKAVEYLTKLGVKKSVQDKLIYYCGKRGGQYLGASYVQKATEDFARIIEEEQDRDLLHKSRVSKRNLVAESRLPLEKQGGIKYALSIHDKVPVPNLGTRFLKRRVSAYIRDSKTGEMKRHTSSLPYNAELTLVKRVARYYQVHAHGKTLYLKTALRNFSKDELPPKNLKKSMDYIIGDSIALGTRSFCNYGEGFHGQRIQYIADILLGRLDNDKIAQDTVSIVCGFNDLPRIKSVDDMRAIYEPLLKAVRLAVSKGKSVKLCGLYRNRSTRRVNHLIEPINDYLKSVCDSMNGVEYVDVFDLNNGRGALHDAKIYNKIAERLT